MKKEEGKKIEVFDTGCDKEEKWLIFCPCCYGALAPFKSKW